MGSRSTCARRNEFSLVIALFHLHNAMYAFARKYAASGSSSLEKPTAISFIIARSKLPVTFHYEFSSRHRFGRLPSMVCDGNSPVNHS